jgi:hypothetical protein
MERGEVKLGELKELLNFESDEMEPIKEGPEVQLRPVESHESKYLSIGTSLQIGRRAKLYDLTFSSRRSLKMENL